MDLIVQKLRDRKIVQWALAYLAGGWLVLQVVDVTEEPWGLPSGVVRGVQAVVALGFFFTLVLAWYHGEQGRQGVSGPELTMIGALFALSAVLLAIFGNPGDDASEGADERAVELAAEPAPAPTIRNASIAVLPFRNNSPDANNAYFADGVHEDILTQLSKIRDLTVLSRTSVMQYGADPQRNLRQIGQELGATTILEGSVRRVLDQIRVTAQLFDAATDASLWADTYDRDLQDVFAVQSEIAQQVAEALQAALTPQEFALISRVPTGSLEAYDLYLRGREAYLKHTSNDNDEAIRLFGLALELDAEYALALAGLARAYADRPYRLGGSPSWADSALVLAERALDVDPNEAVAHNALGFVYGSRGWRQRAYEEYLHAWELDPGESTSMGNVGASHRARGRLDESLAWYERAVRVDPTNMLYRDNIAFVHLVIGDTAQAVGLIREDLARLDPEGEQALRILAGLAVLEDSDHGRALEIFEELAERDPASVEFHFEAAAAAFMLGNYERVITHVGEAGRLSTAALDANVSNARRPRPMLLNALALIQTGREQEGRDSFRELVESRRAVIAEGNEDAPPWMDLAVALAALGDTVEALEAFEQAHQIGRGFVAGVLGPSDAYGEAFALTPLPTEPRFQAVMAQLDADVAELRQRIETRQAGAPIP